MSSILIAIHGLSNKPAPEVLSDGWEKAIREGLLKNERIRDPQFEFTSVYWADVTYDRPDENPDLYKEAEEGALKTYDDSWTDSVKAGLFDFGGDILDAAKKYFGVDRTPPTACSHPSSRTSRATTPNHPSGTPCAAG